MPTDLGFPVAPLKVAVGISGGNHALQVLATVCSEACQYAVDRHNHGNHRYLQHKGRFPLLHSGWFMHSTHHKCEDKTTYREAVSPHQQWREQKGEERCTQRNKQQLTDRSLSDLSHENGLQQQQQQQGKKAKQQHLETTRSSVYTRNGTCAQSPIHQISQGTRRTWLFRTASCRILRAR